MNFLNVQAGFRKGRGTKDQIDVLRLCKEILVRVMVEDKWGEQRQWREERLEVSEQEVGLAGLVVPSLCV